MCQKCLGKGTVSAVAAGLFAVFFFSAFWSQQAYFSLSADWTKTAEVFAKYAVAFFFLGLAKIKAMEAKEAHFGRKKK